MKNLQENIISSKNQNSAPFYRYGGKGLRILFIGNSITKHGPKPEAGWYNDCGMAASEISKDYVHLLISKASEIEPNVSYAILPIANFERDIEGFDIEGQFAEARRYNADIIIIFFGANVNKDYLENTEPFGIAYEKLRNFFSGGNTKIFHSEGFYIRPSLELEKKKVAAKYGDVFIDISDINSREDTHGKYNHPGDLGMEKIAERFWENIKPYVNSD